MSKLRAVSANSPPARLTVIKLGGSVLKNRQDYLRASEFLRRRAHSLPAERLAVVVSAQYGVTDQLQRLAEQLSPQPDRRTLDLLWSSGELSSVALLALSLQRRSVAARGLNVHESGLSLQPESTPPAGLRLQRGRLLGLLRRYPVVIVPGFFASTPGGGMVSLGRGSSDLTALLLARGLKAVRCEMIKDVPGYFDRDPNLHPDARPLPLLSYREAIEMARQGCGLVQREALQAAARLGIPVLVRGLDSPDPCTLLGTTHPAQANGQPHRLHRLTQLTRNPSGPQGL